MTKFIVTFGHEHRSNQNERLQHTYVIIDAEDDESARNKIFNARGDKWAAIYPKHSLQFLAHKWNLTEVPLKNVSSTLYPKPDPEG